MADGQYGLDRYAIAAACCGLSPDDTQQMERAWQNIPLEIQNGWRQQAAAVLAAIPEDADLAAVRALGRAGT